MTTFHVFEPEIWQVQVGPYQGSEACNFMIGCNSLNLTRALLYAYADEFHITAQLIDDYFTNGWRRENQMVKEAIETVAHTIKNQMDGVVCRYFALPAGTRIANGAAGYFSDIYKPAEKDADFWLTLHVNAGRHGQHVVDAVRATVAEPNSDACKAFMKKFECDLLRQLGLPVPGDARVETVFSGYAAPSHLSAAG